MISFKQYLEETSPRWNQYNYQWYLDRLDDITLLDKSFFVTYSNGITELVVPIGGKRKMGSLHAIPDKEDAIRISTIIKERLNPTPYIEYLENEHAMFYGEENSIKNYLHSGKIGTLVGNLHGYSDKAIQTFRTPIKRGLGGNPWSFYRKWEERL